jgi:hypothetical protein
MRNLSIGIVIGLLIAVPVARTGQQPEQIVVGALLQLGMTEDAAVRKVAEAGLTINKAKNNDIWVVSKKNELNEYDNVGFLTFKDSRLVWASRSLMNSGDIGAVKLIRNLYFLVKSYEDMGNTSCTLETQKQEGLEIDNKELMVHCGRRTAALYVVTYKDQQPRANLDESIK